MISNAEFHIFRDSHRRASTPELVAAIRSELLSLDWKAGWNTICSLLLRAGELECALCDADAPFPVCAASAKLTDVFAAAAQGWQRGYIVSIAGSILDEIRYAGALTVGTPEGFAYYAVHPLGYADLVSRLPMRPHSSVVVGIRSIGTTLSAVVSAKLRQQGVPAERFTVRPSGDPYDRHCEFNAVQRQKLRTAITGNAIFLVCDEGPGRSGSSLLSVAEALEREGVPCSSILILCAYEPDVDSLRAPNGARRWLRYRALHAGMTRRLPADAKEFLGSGEWRLQLIPEGQLWPAAWPQMERLRYGSADGSRMWTFEGHGPHGAAVRARNEALAAEAFSFQYLGHENGFGCHKLVETAPTSPDDVAPPLLSYLARYCAWRGWEFAAHGVDAEPLEAMVRVNFEREFGVPLQRFKLEVEVPTICDASMMPCKWLSLPNGMWLKFDAAIHGDSHFFPGPCDIAWDLAGVIVEWGLSAQAREFFLEAYRNASGDEASSRVGAYEIAYSTFEMVWSKMAAASVGSGEEAARLASNYRRHKNFLRSRRGISLGRDSGLQHSGEMHWPEELRTRT